MSSIMRRRRGLKSAISILLSEGGGLQHPHPLSQEAIYATLPLTPRAAASFNLKNEIASFRGLRLLNLAISKPPISQKTTPDQYLGNCSHTTNYPEPQIASSL